MAEGAPSEREAGVSRGVESAEAATTTPQKSEPQSVGSVFRRTSNRASRGMAQSLRTAVGKDEIAEAALELTMAKRNGAQ